MSARPIAGPGVHRHTYFALDSNPFVEVPTSVLADSLEAQYDRGEALNSAMVFEVLDRLVLAQGLAMPPSSE